MGRTNYFRLVALVTDIACHVIQTYIREKILGSSSFESFLNLKRVKHKLFHLYEARTCCECLSDFIKGEKIISVKQFLLLYKSDESKHIQSRSKYVRGICICKYIAIENIDIKSIGLPLAYYIILKCGKLQVGLDMWMRQIEEVRNELFHQSDIQELTDDKLSMKWEKVKGSSLEIAKLINSTFAVETSKKIVSNVFFSISVYLHVLKFSILSIFRFSFFFSN